MVVEFFLKFSHFCKFLFAVVECSYSFTRPCSCFQICIKKIWEGGDWGTGHAFEIYHEKQKTSIADVFNNFIPKKNGGGGNLMYKSFVRYIYYSRKSTSSSFWNQCLLTILKFESKDQSQE